jgi:hypothetical protein
MPFARRRPEEDAMELTSRELWTVLHGMVFGAIFLLAFGGAIAGLWSLRPQLVTPEGVEERMRRLKIGMWAMVIVAWVTVISGTWIVYPWYRAKPPAGLDPSQLYHYPKALLTAHPGTKEWHNFGMEWKEHVAWLVPIIITSIATIVTSYGRRLIELQPLRRALMWILGLAFGAAAVAGVFGAFINKAAATR